MRTLIWKMGYASRSAEYKLWPLGDIHLGNAACDEKLLCEVVAEIAADDFAYWIGMGDYLELINRKDKRFDEESLPSWCWGVNDLARVQTDRLREILAPIGHKCVGMLSGNHEDTICKYWERDVYHDILKAVAPGGRGETLRLDTSGFVLLKFNREGANHWTLPIFATHGYWAGRLMGAGALNLERVFGQVEADIVLAGHDHKKRAMSLSRLAPHGGGGVERVDGYCCSCGSFLNAPRYAAERGYRVLSVGPLCLVVRPQHHEVKVVQ